MKEPFSCFACDAPMVMSPSGYTGWCDPCEVREVRLLDPYVTHARVFTTQPWNGEILKYLDHSAENYPSPA